MGQKKSNKIILILIISLIILVLLLGIAYIYFSTDTFKSNKELFFKYATQMGDEKDGFIDSQLKQYFEKQKNTPYSDEGSISVNITAPSGQEQFENINNTTITFDGQVDTTNSQAIQNISLNYSDDVQFPLIYKQIGKTIGIQTQYIGSKFIAINSEDASLNKLENIQAITNINFSEEDLQHIKDTYVNVLDQQLQDANFSKIEESNTKGYKLTLNGQEFKNIIAKLLETLKGDQQTLNKLNEYIETQEDLSEITTSDIEDIIEEINNDSDIEDRSLEITVYQTNGKITSCIIKISELEIKLEKIVTGNDIQYNINFKVTSEGDEGTIQIAFIAKFAGLQSMQSITENHELSLQYEINNSIIGENEDSNEKNTIIYKYNYNNNITFIENTNIEEFSSDNALMLNEMEKEQQNSFATAVVERIQAVNKMQMEELGLEENENPLIYAIPQLATYSMALNSINTSEINEVEVNTFNEKFEMYESTNLQGATVKGLLTTIARNNGLEDTNDTSAISPSDLSGLSRNNEYLIEEIHFDGEEYEVTSQNILLIKTTIEVDAEYRVEFERDENTGIIYRAVINKK